MKTLKVILKQHTPLIHFQHDQEGATLRASEIKPLLDKFILTELGDGKYNIGCDKAKDKGWFIGYNNKTSLPYQLSIKADTENIKMPMEPKIKEGKQDTDKYGNLLYTTRFPLILSNMGGKKETELVNFSFAKEITLKFKSNTNDDILSLIEKNIDAFFYLHNFGNRASKGFGSFTVSKINNINKNITEKYFPIDSTFLLEFEQSSLIPNLRYFKVLFGVIDYFWKRLKPGINYGKDNDKYKKSHLYTYINKETSKTWEKRTIKTKFNLGDRHIETTPNLNTPAFARALLGMPDKFEYKRGTVNITHPDIERIMSPIYFKPICDKKNVTVYILIKDEHMQSLVHNNKEFTFKCNNETIDLPLNFTINYLDLLNTYKDSFKKNENDDSTFYPIDYKGKPVIDNEVKIYVI